MTDTPEITRIRAALKAWQSATTLQASFDAEDEYSDATDQDGMTAVLSRIDAQQAEIERLKSLITRVHSAKGRYHSQIAMCDLYDAAGLKNVRPTKEQS